MIYYILDVVSKGVKSKLLSLRIPEQFIIVE